MRKTQEATHFKTTAGPDGDERYVPCSPGDPDAWERTLEQLAEARPISHWSPYDRVRVVNFIP